LETGLSSDPDMNRCWSHLDRLKMVSNSDAHSGENLAREATLFHGEPSYAGIFESLSGKRPDYAGTLEFFPEEGKYHLDGHRDCKVVVEPEECLRLNNMCPVCGKPLTVGVLHRVLELADRLNPLEPGKDFMSLVPLAEILGELLDCGPKTKKPQQKLAELTHRFGPELNVLIDTPLNDVGRYWPELGEALHRMRTGQVIRQGGYDGEYGVIRLFDKKEMGPSLLTGASPARKRPLPERATWPKVPLEASIAK
jgi:PHP family Zn ribbon phosphoesterase